jgi:hypothetical protein
VRRDFRRTCAYCLLEEVFAGGEENFELDHFRPQSVFPSSANDFYNLYYSCHPCNRIKRDKWPSERLRQFGVGIVDLCVDEFATHFRPQRNGIWQGLTPSGMFTIDLLRLNRRHLVEVRRMIFAGDLP